MRRKIALALIKFLLEEVENMGLTHAEMRGVHKLIAQIAQQGIHLSSAFENLAVRTSDYQQDTPDIDEIPF